MDCYVGSVRPGARQLSFCSYPFFFTFYVVARCLRPSLRERRSCSSLPSLPPSEPGVTLLRSCVGTLLSLAVWVLSPCTLSATCSSHVISFTHSLIAIVSKITYGEGSPYST